jgi:hypothetical protein
MERPKIAWRARPISLDSKRHALTTKPTWRLPKLGMCKHLDGATTQLHVRPTSPRLRVPGLFFQARQRVRAAKIPGTDDGLFRGGFPIRAPGKGLAVFTGSSLNAKAIYLPYRFCLKECATGGVWRRGIRCRSTFSRASRAPLRLHAGSERNFLSSEAMKLVACSCSWLERSFLFFATYTECY